MVKKVGYAVVGLGVGTRHSDAAIESEYADLIAICDINEELLKEVKEDYKDSCPDLLCYTSFDEMLKNPDIDAISIAVPSGMHADFAVKALEAGKNVLVEKPVDITVEQAMRIEEARQKSGKIAGVVHQNRNNANMKPMYEAIREGRLGKIILGDFSVKWYRKQSYYERNGGWRGTWAMDGGGSLMNQAVHTIDLMLWLMDSEVESVTSFMGIFNHDIETEDLTTSIVRFKNGSVANFISTTCAYPGVCTGIKVYGTKGSIECDHDKLTLWKMEDMAENEEEEMLKKYSGNSAAAALDPTLCSGHFSVVEDMIEAVRDSRNPQILPMEAAKSVELVNAIYESARTGKTVYLNK